jgi:hypothetical protein
MSDAMLPSDVGAWRSDDLQATARQYFGLGADADLPGPVRLLTAVDRIAGLRRAATIGAPEPALPAVFLLRPVPPDDTLAQTRVAPMVDNGLTPIAGRVWFVNSAVCRGRYIDFEYVGDAELFDFVENTLRCGDVPAVVYEPRTDPATLRFYPNGLFEADICTVVAIGQDRDIAVHEILDVIDEIHRRVLVTPDAQDAAGSVWEKADRGLPAHDAEGRIQMHLRTGLTVAFLGCRVRKEQPGIPGRLDLQIERTDPRAQGTIAIFAVLELKVLKSYWSSGNPVTDRENQQAVQDGVRQAATYRDDRHARAAAVCCFDMRREHTGDRCFDDVTDLASRLDVTTKAWHLFWSAADWRTVAAP